VSSALTPAHCLNSHKFLWCEGWVRSRRTSAQAGTSRTMGYTADTICRGCSCG
jgi:hypothetical protein